MSETSLSHKVDIYTSHSFHATVSADLFFLLFSLEGLYRPTSSTLHTMYTVQFPIPTLRVTHNHWTGVPELTTGIDYWSRTELLQDSLTCKTHILL